MARRSTRGQQAAAARGRGRGRRASGASASSSEPPTASTEEDEDYEEPKVTAPVAAPRVSTPGKATKPKAGEDWYSCRPGPLARGKLTYGQEVVCICGKVGDPSHIRQCRPAGAHALTNELVCRMRAHRVPMRKAMQMPEVPPGEGSKGVLLPASWYRAVGDAGLGTAKVWALGAVAPMLDEEERRWLEGEPTWWELALTHEAAAGVPEKFDPEKRPSMVMRVDLPWVPCVVTLAEEQVKEVGDALAEEAVVLLEVTAEKGGRISRQGPVTLPRRRRRFGTAMRC